ncbi:MAG: hypothetical protein HZA78_09490 [Candidatus Schekmanbacteria bacterium]|nr:hypothetical protein [Candidatus Schekmanbacteria bacterium]
MFESITISVPYIISLVSLLMAIFCIWLWRYDRKDELKKREELIKEQLVCQKKMYEMQLSQSREPMVGTNLGGYISINLPDDQRPLFHDLLIGFENYSRLHGYKVRFSVDNSVPQRIGFKLTLADEGITVSPQTVRIDLKDYLERIRRGADFSDLPVIINKKEHDLLLTTMKVRTDFILKSYNISDESKELYEKVLSELSAHPMGISSIASFLQQDTPLPVKNPGFQTLAPYTLEDTAKINPAANLDIKIGTSFNERKLQIEAVNKVIMLLKYDSRLDGGKKEKTILNLDKVKDELAEEDRPDKIRISKWFFRIVENLDQLDLTKETAASVQSLYAIFDLSNFPAFQNK